MRPVAAAHRRRRRAGETGSGPGRSGHPGGRESVQVPGIRELEGCLRAVVVGPDASQQPAGEIEGDDWIAQVTATVVGADEPLVPELGAAAAVAAEERTLDNRTRLDWERKRMTTVEPLTITYRTQPVAEGAWEISGTVKVVDNRSLSREWPMASPGGLPPGSGGGGAGGDLPPDRGGHSVPGGGLLGTSAVGGHSLSPRARWLLAADATAFRRLEEPPVRLALPARRAIILVETALTLRLARREARRAKGRRSGVAQSTCTTAARSISAMPGPRKRLMSRTGSQFAILWLRHRTRDKPPTFSRW